MIFKDFLHYNKSERIGVGILSLLAIIVFLLPNFFSFSKPSKSVNFEAFKTEIAQFQESSKPEEKKHYATDYKRKSYDNYEKETYSPKKYPKKTNEPKTIEKRTLVPFEFNPNNISKEDLVKMGLSDKVINTILKFRSKGGQFWKQEDLAKIYGLSENDYLKLQPFIILEKPTYASNFKDGQKNYSNYKKDTSQISYNKKPYEPKKYAPKEEVFVEIDINNSTPEDWQKIKGIGPYFSTKIVEYREKLGGFAAIEQVNETYGLPDSVFQSIRSQLQLKTPISQNININTATVEEMKSHPYIPWKKAKIIVNYREMNGAYRQLEDLAKIKILDQTFIDRLAPYVIFED